LQISVYLIQKNVPLLAKSVFSKFAKIHNGNVSDFPSFYNNPLNGTTIFKTVQMSHCLSSKGDTMHPNKTRLNIPNLQQIYLKIKFVTPVTPCYNASPIASASRVCYTILRGCRVRSILCSAADSSRAGTVSPEMLSWLLIQQKPPETAAMAVSGGFWVAVFGCGAPPLWGVLGRCAGSIRRTLYVSKVFSGTDNISEKPRRRPAPKCSQLAAFPAVYHVFMGFPRHTRPFP